MLLFLSASSMAVRKASGFSWTGDGACANRSAGSAAIQAATVIRRACNFIFSPARFVMDDWKNVILSGNARQRIPRRLVLRGQLQGSLELLGRFFLPPFFF